MTRHPFNAKPLAWTACAKCVAAETLHRHHVYPVAFGGVDEPWNLCWLCSDHHRERHGLRRSRLLKTKGHRHAAWVFMRWLSEVPVARRQHRSTITAGMTSAAASACVNVCPTKEKP